MKSDSCQSLQVVAVKQLDRNGLQGNREFLVEARPLFKDRRTFPQMADPLLQGCYPMRGLYQALAVAAMCVQEQATMRPLIADVVTALSYLASQTYDPGMHLVQRTRLPPPTPSHGKKDTERKQNGGSDKEKSRANRRVGVRSPSIHAQASPDQRPSVAETKVWGENWSEKKRGNTRGGMDGCG